MNNCTNSHIRSGVTRVLSWMLALALIFSLAAVPTASADADTYSAEVVFSANGMDISGKIALDVNQVLLGVIAGMGAQGQSLLNAAVYLGTQALVVDSTLIGGGYGIDLTAVAENLPQSIFAPSSGSAYALEQEAYDRIMSMLNAEPSQSTPVPSVNIDIQAMAESLSVLAEAYSGIPEKILTYPTIESSDASVEINGKPMQVSQIRCTMDADSSVDAVNTLIAPLQGNDQAQQALAVLIDQCIAASQADLGATGEQLVETIVSQLPQELENARAELEEENFSVSAVACLNPVTLMPVKFAIEASSNTENVAINLLMSETLDFFRLEAMENGSLAGAFDFAITENSDSALACSFSIQDGNREEVRMSFQLNKEGKAFLLSLTVDGETLSVSGYYSTTDTMFSATVDQLDGQDFGGSLTLNLRSDDSIALPSFTEITTLTEDEFTTLVQTVSQLTESLSAMLG